MSSNTPRIIQRIKVRFWWGGYSPLDAMSAIAPTLPASCRLEVNTSGAWRTPEENDLYTMRTWLEDNDFFLSDTVKVRERSGTNRAWMALYSMTWAKRAREESREAYEARMAVIEDDNILNHLAGY